MATAIIDRRRQIHIEWTIRKAMSKVKEDFSRARLIVLLHSKDCSKPLHATISNNVLSIDIAAGLVPDRYDIEAIWVKNSDRLVPSIEHHTGRDPRYNDSDIAHSRVDDVFAITDAHDENMDIAEISLVTSTATYGYDGLSAYEIFVLRNSDTDMTDSDWVRYLQPVPNGTVTGAMIADDAYDVKATQIKNPDQEVVGTQYRLIKGGTKPVGAAIYVPAQGGTSTADYAELMNRPSVNGVELEAGDNNIPCGCFVKCDSLDVDTVKEVSGVTNFADYFAGAPANGQQIAVMFTNGNSASEPKLKVTDRSENEVKMFASAGVPLGFVRSGMTLQFVYTTVEGDYGWYLIGANTGGGVEVVYEEAVEDNEETE